MGGRFRRQLRGERERDGSLVMSLLGGGIGAWCGVCPCPELENEEKPGGRARGGSPMTNGLIRDSRVSSMIRQR